MLINHWICILYIKFWLPAGDESGKWCKINKSWKNALWKILKLTLKNCWISRWRYFRCSCWFESLIKTILYYSIKNHQKWIKKSMDNFIHPNCYNFRIIAVKVPSIRKVLFFLNKNFLKRKVLKNRCGCWRCKFKST